MVKPRKVFTIFLLIGVVFLFVFGGINTVSADITITRSFSATSSDAYTSGNSAYGFADAVYSDSTTSTVGVAAENAYFYRSYLFYDTSIIPLNATITSATVSLNITTDNSDGDFNVTVRYNNHQASPITYTMHYYNWFSADGGSRNTSTIAGAGYWNITLSATGIGWITKGGTTQFALQNNHDYYSGGGSGASSNEYLSYCSSEVGSTGTPTLYVTYTIVSGGGGTVTMHGPYLETGAVFNGTVNVTLYYSSNSSETVTLDGSDGVADTASSSSDNMPINCFWNCSSDYTKMRVHTFSPTASLAEIWVCVANTETETLNQYYVSITDFAGITNGYVSTMKNVGGSTRVIERVPLDIMNNMPFWLITYNQYTLKVESDNGTFTWNLPADVIGTKGYLISKDMVTQTSTARNFTVAATRVNGSIINIQYYDPTISTISVTSNITYYSNYVWASAYLQTDSVDNNINYNWTNAEATRNYVAVIIATTTSGTYQWNFALAPPVAENLLGASLNIFGNWPFPANQVPGLVIAGLFFGLLSWRDTEIGCAIGLVVTCILWIIGLLEVPVMGVAIGFMLVVFMYLHRGKETLRTPP